MIQEQVFDVYLDLAVAKEGVVAFKKLAKGKSYPLLIVAGSNKGISREARQFYESEFLATYSPAVALYTKSRMMKMVGSFFLGWNKTSYPFRIFTDKTAALEWLKQYAKMEQKVMA